MKLFKPNADIFLSLLINNVVRLHYISYLISAGLAFYYTHTLLLRSSLSQINIKSNYSSDEVLDVSKLPLMMP